MVRPFVAVQIAPWQQEWPIYAGIKRFIYNAGKVHDKNEYKNKKLLQPDITANIASCFCEYAASKYFNQSWNGPYWRPEYHAEANVAPDFGNNGAVRRTRTYPDTRISVLPHESQFLLVQAFIPDVVLFPLVERALAGLPPLNNDVYVWLLGQIDGHTAWYNGTPFDTTPHKRWCDAAFLQPIPPDSNNKEPSKPPLVQKYTDMRLLDAHRRVVAELGFADVVAGNVRAGDEKRVLNKFELEGVM